jgi:hypothetical protein
VVHNQFCVDFHVDPLGLLSALGVPARSWPGLLRKLAVIYDAARKNQEQ